jgi:hypothetical protein
MEYVVGVGPKPDGVFTPFETFDGVIVIAVETLVGKQ